MGVFYVDYQVFVAGQDVTSRFDPLLTSMKITRSSGEAADECSLELADPDGAILLPTKRDTVLININGNQAFQGWVADTDYDFGTDGRKLSISASSIDQGSKVKEPVLAHKDGGTLSSVAAEFGKKAGLQVSVAGSVASIERPYWVMQNESFMGWGQRMADLYGASFKIIGSRAFLVGINEGLSASGRALTPIEAAYGRNMLSGSIAPIISRPRFKDVEISYFDVKKGEKVKQKVPTGIADVEASLRTVITAADEAQAKHRAGAHGKKSDREKGSGSVVILLDILAEPEANCNISGVRPGIDGSYRISSASHEITKGGSQTTLDLKQPQGSAGVDSRGSPGVKPTNPATGLETGVATDGGVFA